MLGSEPAPAQLQYRTRHVQLCILICYTPRSNTPGASACGPCKADATMMTSMALAVFAALAASAAVAAVSAVLLYRPLSPSGSPSSPALVGAP